MGQPESVSTTSAPLESPKTHGGHRVDRKQWLFLVRIVLLVLLVVLGYKVVRAALFGMSAYNEAKELRQLIGGDMSPDEMANAHESMTEAARSVTALEREMRLFSPLFRSASWIPGIGPTVAAVPDLLRAGKEYALVGNETFGLAAAYKAANPEASTLQAGMAAMEDNAEAFAILAEHAAAGYKALERIDPDKLVSSLRSPVEQIQSAAALAGAGIEMAPYLPELMGFHGPKRYLALVQNNHELRATGGFISAVGLVTLDNGAPGEIELTDSYNIVRNDVDHPWAPDPMREHMGIELVFLRDANWSPDLPTTGTLAQSLYRQDAGTEVDGVVTIDLMAVELLVDALGPLKVKGSPEPITGENLVDQIKQFWDQPIDTGDTKESAGEKEWWKQRKDFMPTLTQAALNRVKSGRYNPLAISAAGKQALDERAIQVWLADAEADAVLAKRQWNGAVLAVDGADFIGLVDTNMGYNKVDSVLERSLDYAVSWPEGAERPAVAEATITYTHPVNVPGHECDQRPRYGDNYDAMTERCYFDYVRLYTPAGSELLSIEGVEPETVDAALGEGGTTVFSGYFVMKPGTEHTVRFQYRLPERLKPQDYRLAIRRQAGSSPLPVHVEADGNTLDTLVTLGHFLWDPASK